MNTMEPAVHSDLTETDMENTRAVLQSLLDDVRRQELERQLLAAAVTWVSAFSAFKRLRNKIGLPVNPHQKLYYGALLGSLKAAGKMLLAWEEKEKPNLAIVGLRTEDLEACVAELIDDDRMLDGGLLDADFSDLEAKFCSA